MGIYKDADQFLNVQLMGGAEQRLTHDAVTLDVLYRSPISRHFDHRNLNRCGVPPTWAQDGKRQSVLLQSDPVICRLKALMSPDRELGPLIRLSILIVEVGRALMPKAGVLERDTSLTRVLDAAYRASMSQPPHSSAWYPREAVDSQMSSTRGGRSPLSAADVLAPDVGKRALISLANQHLRSPHGLPPLTWDGYMETPLRKMQRLDTALLACKNWLCLGHCLVDPHDSFDLGNPSDAVDKHPEVLAIAKRLQQLASLSLAERRPMVQLHSTSHTTLGRAVLRQLCSNEAREEHGLMPIHLEASRFDDPDFAFTAKGFLAPLGRAFGIDLGDLSQPYTEQELADVINLFRRALTCHEVLVIVHGISNASGATASVLDFITGVDLVMDMARCLMLPSTSREKTDIPSRTLWVTLSTHSVGSWLPFSEEVFDLETHSWALSGSSINWEKVRWAWVGKTNPGIHAKVPVQGGRIPLLMPDLKDWLMPNTLPSDLDLMWLSTLGRFQKLQQPAGLNSATKLDRSNLLARLAVEQWASADPCGFWLLVVVAVTPEGVSFGTLRRLVVRVGALLAMNQCEEAAQFLKGADLDCLLNKLQGKRDAATDFSDASILQSFKPLLAVAKEQVTQLYLSDRTLRWEVGPLGGQSTELKLLKYASC